MDGTDDQGQKILISTWILLVLSAAFLLARLYCKWTAHRGFWWDDHVLILSWLALLGTVLTTTWSVPHGLGQHESALAPTSLPPLSLAANLTATLSIVAAVWSKTSFALTLLRVTRGSPARRALLWFIVVSANVAMGLNALFIWVRCLPVARSWNSTVQGTCWPDKVYLAYGMFAAGYSAATDFVLALLPWQMVWKLQMKGKEKVGVAVAMSMGIFAGVTSIVKTLEIPALAAGDFTYNLTGLIIWGTAESAVTIMAASIPVLRTLFRDLRVSNRRRSNDHHAASSRITAITTATAGAGAGASKASSGSRSTGSSSSAPGYDDDDDDDDYDFDGSEEDGHELAEAGADSRSDECIIGDAEKAPGRIIRSTVVEVRYHAADGKGDPPGGATCGTGDGSK